MVTSIGMNLKHEKGYVNDDLGYMPRTYFNFFMTELTKNILKACVRYFLSNFYFFTNSYLFKNYEKCFLFHLKGSFRSQDIQIFWFFPFLSTLSRFERTDGSGIVYDVMNWIALFWDNSKTASHYIIKLCHIIYNE